jgi:hypothetical protein
MADALELERRWGELAEIAALMQPGDDHLDPLDREVRADPQPWAAGLSSAAGAAARRTRDVHANVHSDRHAAGVPPADRPER